jgi:hypothetical protein
MTHTPPGRHDRPKAFAETERNGYKLLVQAIIARAVDDAAGRCTPRDPQAAVKYQEEAQWWLREETGVIELLELAGYESDHVLPRVRALLNDHPVAG